MATLEQSLRDKDWIIGVGLGSDDPAYFPDVVLPRCTTQLPECSAGSARHCVPRRTRSYAALRLPRSLRPPLRSSLANGLPRCGGLFFTVAPPSPPTSATSETFLPRLPISRHSPEEKRGDPRCLGHPLRACRGQRPRRLRPPLARSRCRRLSAPTATAWIDSCRTGLATRRRMARSTVHIKDLAENPA